MPTGAASTRCPSRLRKPRWLSPSEIGIVHAGHERHVVLGRQSCVKQPGSPAGGQEDDGVTEIDDGHTSALIEAPPVADSGRDGHLAAGGDEELRSCGHCHILRSTW